jgi:hypothetical protein
MKKVDDRTAANMEVALEEVCRTLPYGGDHKTRKRVAKKLIHSARRDALLLAISSLSRGPPCRRFPAASRLS